MNRAEVLALIDLIIAILDSSDSLENARNEVRELRAKLQAGVWDEVLSKLNV